MLWYCSKDQNYTEQKAVDYKSALWVLKSGREEGLEKQRWKKEKENL